MAVLGGFQEIDVHNMTRTQALAAIDARLRRCGAAVYVLFNLMMKNDSLLYILSLLKRRKAI